MAEPAPGEILMANVNGLVCDFCTQSIRKIVGKILSLVIAAALIFVAWQQRDKVTDYAAEVRGQACDSAAGAVDNPTTREATSFLGIGISLPDGWCTP